MSKAQIDPNSNAANDNEEIRIIPQEEQPQSSPAHTSEEIMNPQSQSVNLGSSSTNRSVLGAGGAAATNQNNNSQNELADS